MNRSRFPWLLVLAMLAVQTVVYAQQQPPSKSSPKVREPFTALQWAEPTPEEEIIFNEFGWRRTKNPRVGDVVAFKSGNNYVMGTVSDPVKKLYIPEDGGPQTPIPEGAKVWHYIWKK